MGKLSVNRACGRCGERIRLEATAERSYYDCDLEALLSLVPGERLRLEAHCGCGRPRRVRLEGRAVPESAVD